MVEGGQKKISIKKLAPRSDVNVAGDFVFEIWSKAQRKQKKCHEFDSSTFKSPLLDPRILERKIMEGKKSS